MNKHSEYEKMPQSLKQLALSEEAFNELNKVKWVVTEKIHGANFSFVYESQKLLYAKRKEFLNWNDDFFGFQEVVAGIEDSILQLFERLSADIAADRYIVYGELFGGEYPHPQVPVRQNVHAIQTGVYYSPAIHFCAFDIAIEIRGVKHYIDYQTAVEYFERSNVFHANVLSTGRLNEVLSFNTRIDSTIPAQLGLPKLTPNLIEGVVIKPLSHSELRRLDSRPIFKLKNPEFDEDKKFHGAEKWSFIPMVSAKTEELAFIVEEIAHYVNQNRLNSAISKIGRIDFENPQRLQAIHNEMLEDICGDFNASNANILNELELDQQEWIMKRLQAMISKQIDIFLNTPDHN